MKTIIISLLLLTGCQTSVLTVGDATFKTKSFFYPLKMDHMKFTTTSTNGIKGLLDIKGYTSDQAELFGAITEAAVKGAISGIKP